VGVTAANARAAPLPLPESLPFRYPSVTSSCPSSKVPSTPGWKTMTDPATGVNYYVNLATGTSQWEAPPGAAGANKQIPPPPPEPSKAPLPAGWSEGVDPGSGRTYYFNAATMASQWTPP